MPANFVQTIFKLILLSAEKKVIVKQASNDEGRTREAVKCAEILCKAAPACFLRET